MPEGKGEVRDQGAEPWEVSLEGRVVVIGLGNLYMRDDGIGLRAARILRERRTDVFVYETQDMDLSLLWQFRNARKIVILDSLRSGEPPGTVTVHAIAPDQNAKPQIPSLHALQLHDLFDLASDRDLISCPVAIVGAEPKDCGPGEALTEELVAAVPRMVELALSEIDR